VYRGTDLRLQRPVAVKIFHEMPTELVASARQRNEMLFLARLSHPNLVSMYDARMMTSAVGEGPSGRVPHSYLIMELVDGVSLAQRLSGTPLTMDEAGSVGIAVANALAAVHKLELVHRDVKPANILLPAAGGAKLTDFGIARQMNSAHLTITAEVVGTPLYLSPEQAAGREVGPGTDIYSLGLVLLECLTGTPEFPGAPVHSAIARTMRDPRVPINLPAPWPGLLRSMTRSIPDERPTAAEVAAILTNYLQDRERSRTATTVTFIPPGGELSVPDPVTPGRRHPISNERGSAPTLPRAPRDLPVMSCGLVVAIVTAVVMLTATGDGDHPAGPTTTYSTVTRTVPARGAAATSIPPTANPVATYRADGNLPPSVTVITTETATETTTTTPTTVATTTTSESTTQSPMANESTVTSTSTSESTATTTTSESTLAPTTPGASTPSTTTTSSAPSTGSESIST
jgi:serine/threonine protein kinase